MAEGGQLPWKLQKIDQHRGPPGNYDCIVQGTPLPTPPIGSEWRRDKETCEWSVFALPRKTDGGGHISSSFVGDDAIARKKDIGELPSHDFAVKSTVKSTAVEGVEYVMHTVLPADTFSGLCLRYALTPVQLRRANCFSGSNLKLAPSTLVIPLGKDGLNGGRIRLQDRDSEEFKLHAFLSDFPRLRNGEARAYLLMSSWNIEKAKDAARDDIKWEEKSDTVRPKIKEAGSVSSWSKEEKMIMPNKKAAGPCNPWDKEAGAQDLTLHVHTAVPADEEVVCFGWLRPGEKMPLLQQIEIELPKFKV